MFARILVAIGLIVLPAGAWAQPVGDFSYTYFPDSKTGCKLWWRVWPPIKSFYPTEHIAGRVSVTAVQWSGPCRGGFAEGRGTFRIEETRTVDDQAPIVWTWSGEGDFAKGKRTGRGFIVSSNGFREEGEFVDGKLSGRGIRIVSNANKQSRFDATFQDGKANGWGVEDTTSVVGNKGQTLHYHYEGEFRDGMHWGKGKETQSISGCSVTQEYEGEYAQNKYDGRGTLKARGRTYTGVWSMNRIGGVDVYDVNIPRERRIGELSNACGD